jgi:hypothetical protein
MGIEIRPFSETDIPALQVAIERDTFHPGEWSIKHFYDDPNDPDAMKIPKEVATMSDEHGPIAFVRYTKSLRISCVWNDETDNHRNGRAVLNGIFDAIKKARASGFTEIIITTESEKLATFFEKILKMKRSRDEFLLQV